MDDKKHYLMTKNLFTSGADEKMLDELDANLTELCTRKPDIRWCHVMVETDGKITGGEVAFDFTGLEEPELTISEVKSILSNVGIDCESFTEAGIRNKIMACSSWNEYLLSDDFKWS